MSAQPIDVPIGNEPRILVVDDEIVIRQLMTDILADEGFSVESAPNGRAALEMLKQSRDFVVLFTDIMMPEMDGIQLIREARQVSPDLVPIVMTGYATLETARAAVKEGAYDYVLKPFNLSEIKLAVSNALERSRLQQENARLREVSELFQISERLAAIREEGSLLNYVLEAATERVGAERGSLMLVSPDGNSLEVACSVGLSESFQGSVVPADETISGWVSRRVQPLLVSDLRTVPELNPMARGLDTGSFASVPLERKVSDLDESIVSELSVPRVLAVLNVTNKRGGGDFNETDLKMLSIIANHAAAAIENVRLLRDMEFSQREIVFTLGEIVETRSHETGNHVKRVAEYSKVLGLRMGLIGAEAEVLRLASPLHDVGKVGIPDSILNKPGKLTPDEYDVIKTHSQIGYDMLKVTKGRVLRAAAVIAQQHHERFDGQGYPDGLAGTDIHLFGRIVCIADVFDALGVERVYKPAWDLEKILDYFQEQRGKHFDPELVDVFLSDLDEITAIRDALAGDGIDAAE